ncbi:MAG: nucleoside/nucleotide kinase family protein [Ancrocorticia sp.]|uniref:nucleoside/nucleotide kinase family protein n=1 Tax=Ancrocorticia sp. TaxID=2593684 RepID=UPI003F90526E
MGASSSSSANEIAPELAGEILDNLRTQSRVIVGIAGEPGAGKSTLSGRIRDLLEAEGIAAAVVPMDGFHLANEVLEALGRRDRKGAIDTFDADGYVAMLRRIRAAEPGTVYAPRYDRGASHGVAGAIPVGPECRVVLTEGNYLLDSDSPWREIPGLLDAVWFVQIDPALRRERLIARHIASGKAPEFAEYWVDNVDEPNARRIRAVAGRAHRIVDPG